MSTDRRGLIAAGLAFAAAPALAATPGEKLATAARRQLGVTRGYDGAYVKLAYPGGDVPRTTGVCADVIIRAAREGLALDLQKLVHEDMKGAFSAYPSRRAWGLKAPDANIDHRRVLNLEAFWRRAGAELWASQRGVLGSSFPNPFAVGDLLTWRVGANLPHVGVVSKPGWVIHNIGGGAEEAPLALFVIHKGVGHYRWPKA